MGAFSEFDQLHEHMEKMWQRLSGGHPGQPRFRPPVIEPPADVYETPDAVVVLIELAGIRGQDIELRATDGRLVVRGEKADPHCHDEPAEHVYSQMEIAHGPFECSIILPAVVDGERASIRYEDGMLEITLPKRQVVAARRIKVTVAGSSSTDSGTD